MGNTDAARRMLDELKAARTGRVVSAWGIAALHASLGDVDEAFQWLETAFAEGATVLSSCASTRDSIPSGAIRGTRPCSSGWD